MRRYTFHSQNYREPKVFLSKETLSEIWRRVDQDECRLATGDLVKIECQNGDGSWWTFGCFVLASKWEGLSENDFNTIVGWDRLVVANLVRTARISGWQEVLKNKEECNV